MDGAGGVGHGFQQWSAPRLAGGGAGNPGGFGGINNVGPGGTIYGKGEDGTGGLLIIYSNNLNNIGKIEAHGSKGGDYSIGGGSSGGGSINIFYKENIELNGSIEANGGQAVNNGANGGNGSVSIGQILKGKYESTFKNY